MHHTKALLDAAPAIFVNHIITPQLYTASNGACSFYKYAVAIFSDVHSTCTDLFFKDMETSTASTTQYGVPWDRFIRGAAKGRWVMQAQHAYTPLEHTACADSNASFWAPSSQHGGDASPAVEAAMQHLNWGDDSSGVPVDLMASCAHIDEVVTKMNQLRRLRSERVLVLGLRSFAYALTAADQLWRGRLYVRLKQ